MSRMQDVRRDLEGLSEDARFTAWMTLYNAPIQDEKEAGEIIHGILRGGDPILKIQFARFLARLHEEKAVGYLRELLQDEGPNVFDAARKAFERNRYGLKVNDLLPLLTSRSRPAKFFAMERLSLGGVEQAVEELLAELRATDEEVLLHTLSAVRHFPSERMLKEVLPLLRDQREEVRFRTVLAVGACYGAGFGQARRPLLHAFEDESSRIRQAVLWSMRKKPHEEDLPLLFKASAGDPETAVRQESLVELSLFPREEVVRHLLKILVHERDRLVILKAEGVLMAMPTAQLIRGLRKVLVDADSKVRNKALVLFAEFQQDSEKYFEHLKSGFSKVDGEKEKIAFIEAFGVLGNPRAVPLLESLLKASFIQAYAAMGALLKIWRNHREVSLLAYLEDETLPMILKQIILKEIVQKGSPSLMTDRLRSLLHGFLRHENINVRYLVSQVLVHFDEEASLVPLIDALARETDETSAKFIREGLQRSLARHPAWFAELIAHYRRSAPSIQMIFSFLASSPIKSGDAVSLAVRLMGEPFRMMDSPHRAPFVEAMGRLVANKRVMMGDLLEGLEWAPASEAFLQDLATHLEEWPYLALPLSPAHLSRWFEKGGRATKNAVLALAGHGGERSLIPFLVHASLGGESRGGKTAAASALQRLLAQSPVSGGAHD